MFLAAQECTKEISTNQVIGIVSTIGLVLLFFAFLVWVFLR